MNTTPLGTEKETADKPKRQPVILYILILFIVAFLLMGLSLLMHQRSNTEALGQLQNSVNNIQMIQENQEKIIALQDEVSQLEDQLAQANRTQESLTADLETANTALAESKQTADALAALYNLQQDYLTEDYDGCQAILQMMEDTNLAVHLPKSSLDGATSPATRYLQLREAINSKLK